MESVLYLILLTCSGASVYASTLIARALAERAEVRVHRRKLARGEIAAIPRGTPATFTRSVVVLAIAPVLIVVSLLMCYLTIQASRDLQQPWNLVMQAGEGWMLTALGIVQVACALVCAAIWFDPSAGRRRCPRCWYEVDRVSGKRCTECGHESAAEHQFFRTRRKPGLAWTGALLLLLAWPALRATSIARTGIFAIVPTTLMILTLEHWPDELIGSAEDGRGSEASLLSRRDRRELFEWQRELLEWKTRRLLEKSRDVDDLYLATWCIDHAMRDPIRGKMEFEISPETMRGLMRGLASSDPDVRIKSAAVLQETPGWGGRGSDEGAPPWKRDAAEFAGEVAPALVDADDAVAASALAVVLQRPGSADHMIPRLEEEIAKDTSGRRRRARMAIFILSRLACESEPALASYMKLLDANDVINRALAISFAGPSLQVRAQVFDRLRGIMREPDATMAERAMRVIAWSGEGPRIADDLLQLISVSGGSATGAMGALAAMETLQGVVYLPEWDEKERARVFQRMGEIIGDDAHPAAVRLRACRFFTTNEVLTGRVRESMRSLLRENVLGETDAQELRVIIEPVAEDRHEEENPPGGDSEDGEG